MPVKLIAKTVPVVPTFQTTEELIAYCARVSNPSNQNNLSTAQRLLRYCMRKRHWSIFEMADFVFEVQCTRDIGRQIIRHRSFSFQEFSQRYAVVDVTNFVVREARLQDSTNRQNSLDLPDDHDLHEGWEIWQKKVAQVASNAYQWALSNGIAKEQARAVLPEGMTLSTMYMKGSLRSWIHYIDVRATRETQKEHRLIAEEMKTILMNEFDFLKEHWNNEQKDKIDESPQGSQEATKHVCESCQRQAERASLEAVQDRRSPLQRLMSSCFSGYYR